jgi:Flp pilus assembly pilin Flp
MSKSMITNSRTTIMRRNWNRRPGQSLVEYALILAMIAVVAILVLQGLGGKVNNTLSSVNSNLP